MKNFPINRKVYSDLLFLLENYTDNDMPPTDYLNLIQGKALCQEKHYESVVEMFLSLVQHKKMFIDFIDHFYCLGKRRDYTDKHSLIVFTYILISILNTTNKDDIIHILNGENCQKIVNFLRFFNKESVTERLFLLGCQYFEEKYTNEKIIMNIKKNKDLLQDIQKYFEETLGSKKAEHKPERTIPITPRITAVMRQGPHPPVPVNTPEERVLPPPKPIPASTYKESKVNEVLMELKREHREASQKLLEEANKATKHFLTAQAHKQHICQIHSDKPVFQQKRKYKSHKGVKTDIFVKKNAATILREASRLIKEEEKDIQRMKELVCGAANHNMYEELVDQLRAEEEQLKLQDIEKKHLMGQLTREEAILAKQRVLDANKAKRAQIEKEKREIDEILKQMQQKQEEEIKQMIEKTQQIKKNIEAKRLDIIYKKQLEAQEVASTSKQLYEEAMLRNKEELEKRIEIIKEIKALSILKDLQTNKFDPTETMNTGLLCEMSLAELYERLLLKRTSIKEEIENRQKCIRKQKLKQQQFLADTQQFIDVCREQKKVLSTKKDSAYKEMNILKTESQEILQLREKLEQARQKRMALTKN